MIAFMKMLNLRETTEPDAPLKFAGPRSIIKFEISNVLF